MSARHALLALVVVSVWGTNFVVAKQALATLPPLTFTALRFALAFLPAALFIARPEMPWRRLAAYGLAIGVGQFGLLFYAMKGDITPGLAALVIQSQVFMTIGLAMAINGERLTRVQVVALALAAAGLALIALHVDATTTPLGLVLVLAAALCWAGGNLVAQRAGRVPILGFMVWSSLFAVPPLVLLALLVDGPHAIARGLRAADGTTWVAVGWQAWGNTLFGYGAWAWLMARYPAATVSPWALLVPVFGIGASALLLGEPLPAWKVGAATLVIGGLALNLWFSVARAPKA
ncbi:MAG TPA: EamA family transporter [Burkholderiaceae bacterium]|nr:EamA family transporter [Burkholderiaceae bacterium]